jgi:hypothetical protein
LELRDIIVTPIIIFLVYVFAYIIRHRVTDTITIRYYFPALTLKILGAIALGILYQYYYSDGDTYTFHRRGSRVIWEAFMDSPTVGLKLFFKLDGIGLWQYIQRIPFYFDDHSFVVIRLAFLFDLITFSSYSATAVLFSVLSFIGGWMLFKTFYKRYPNIHRSLALSCLFVPSVIFWGSGLLKDTLTLSCIGIATYSVYILFIERKISIRYIGLLLLAMYVIFSVKIYILMSLTLGLVLWIFFYYFFKINSGVLRTLVVPFVIVLSLSISYYGVSKLSENDSRYALNRIAETAKITAYDIRYYSGKDAGSGYSLGELDGTIESLIWLAPAAINVTMFRPYLWEVKNPLMVLAAIESLFTLLFTLYVLFKVRQRIFKYVQTPEVVFGLIFSIAFAFGVGISTYNFGSLARYKIPFFPFYFSMLSIILYQFNLEKSEEIELMQIEEV